MRLIHGVVVLALAGLPGFVSAAQPPSNKELSNQIDSLQRRVERLERREKSEKAQRKEERQAERKAERKEKEKAAAK
jgi:TolA-binding protein